MWYHNVALHQMQRFLNIVFVCLLIISLRCFTSILHYFRPPTFVPDFHDEPVVRSLTHHQLGKTDLIVPGMTFGNFIFALKSIDELQE